MHIGWVFLGIVELEVYARYVAILFPGALISRFEARQILWRQSTLIAIFLRVLPVALVHAIKADLAAITLGSDERDINAEFLFRYILRVLSQINRVNPS